MMEMCLELRLVTLEENNHYSPTASVVVAPSGVLIVVALDDEESPSCLGRVVSFCLEAMRV